MVRRRDRAARNAALLTRARLSSRRRLLLGRPGLQLLLEKSRHLHPVPRLAASGRVPHVVQFVRNPLERTAGFATFLDDWEQIGVSLFECLLVGLRRCLAGFLQTGQSLSRPSQCPGRAEPSFTPRFLAAARAAFVRSLICSASCSATAARM